MKTIPLLVALLATVSCLTSASFARAEHTRVTNPTAINVEGLGRGALYSVQLDRVFSDDIAAGAGFGTVPVNNVGGGSTGQMATMVPLYALWYFTRESTSLFATGGATIIANYSAVAGTVATPSGIAINGAANGNLGFGIENRSDAGFLLRLTGYLIYSDKIYPWAGATFGYSF